MNPQRRIAQLMEAYELGLGQTGETADGSPGRMSSDLPSAGSGDVVDGLANRPQTQLRACAAGNCKNNVGDSRCSLTAIQVNQTGGCDDYEPEADDYDDDDELEGDEQVIAGISDAMPDSPDQPSSMPGQMYGRFNNGTMQ